MKYRTFLTFNIIGGFAWTWGMLWMGYGLGSIIPNPDRFVIPVVIVIVLISSAPALRELFREYRRRIKSMAEPK
jgi:membrane-associated protein